MAAHLPQSARAGQISFRLGHPDRISYPGELFRQALQAAWVDETVLQSLEYAPERGNPGLLEQLSASLAAEEDVRIPLENLMLIPGSTGGIDMIARIFAKTGPVLLEAPTYGDAIHLFRDHRLKLLSIPLDKEGIRADLLERTILQLVSEGEAPSILYTIPSFQNPTGVTASRSRRIETLSILQRHHILLVEDDVYRDIAFGAKPPPSYYALAGGKGVLRIGSFSKTIAPGLRLGWLIGEASLINRCLGCGVLQMGGGANPLAAQVVANFIEAGHMKDHLKRIRSLYRTRRDRALAALDKFMPEGIQWTRPHGGFFIWLSLPSRIQSHQIQHYAEERGVWVSSGEGFYTEPDQGKHQIRLAFSFVEGVQMEEGIRILAEGISQTGIRS